MRALALGLTWLAGALSACATAGTASNTGGGNTAVAGNATVNVILGGNFYLPPPEEPCRRAIERTGRSYDQADFLGAVAQGQTQTVTWFLQCKIPLDTRAEVRHGTALMLAAQFGHLEMTKLLLDHGANVSDTDAQEWTALMYAVENPHPGQRAIVELLLDRGADARVQGEDGATPLSLAAQVGAADVVAALVKANADVKGIDGIKALLEAVTRGNLGVARVLLDAGTDPNMTLQGRPGALATATWKKDTSMQCLLLRHGAQGVDLGGPDPATWRQGNCTSGVRITSEPAGAMVRHDSTTNYVVGTTPIADAELAKVRMNLQFVLEGYEPVTLNADLQQSADKPFHQVLQKSKSPPPTPPLLVFSGSAGPAPPATPIYKKWWFWTAIGAGVVTIVAISAGAAVGSGGPDVQTGVLRFGLRR